MDNTKGVAARRAFASLGERLCGYVTALNRRRRSLEYISLIYRDQMRVYPIQLEAMLERLEDVRRVVLGGEAYLRRLNPQDTAQLRPYACIEKLSSLDDLLTEIVLTMAMHAEVCTTVSYHRVQLHLSIRRRLPAIVASYDDTTAMLEALAIKVRDPEPTHVGSQENEQAGRIG